MYVLKFLPSAHSTFILFATTNNVNQSFRCENFSSHLFHLSQQYLQQTLCTIKVRLIVMFFSEYSLVFILMLKLHIIYKISYIYI